MLAISVGSVNMQLNRRENILVYMQSVCDCESGVFLQLDFLNKPFSQLSLCENERLKLLLLKYTHNTKRNILTNRVPLHGSVPFLNREPVWRVSSVLHHIVRVYHITLPTSYLKEHFINDNVIPLLAHLGNGIQFSENRLYGRNAKSNVLVRVRMVLNCNALAKLVKSGKCHASKPKAQAKSPLNCQRVVEHFHLRIDGHLVNLKMFIQYI